MTVASIAACAQQTCAAAASLGPHFSSCWSEPKPYEINELQLSFDLEARKRECCKMIQLRNRNARCAPSVTEDHNSDKQSHDVCVNCNTHLLQPPFKNRL